MLIDMYSLVESVTASALILWGLALMINGRIIQSFYNTFTQVEKHETLNYLAASMFLLLGLITIWVHNDWYWSWTVVVTFIGWVLTLKASLWLFYPQFVASLTKKFSKFILNFYLRMIYGSLMILSGLLIFAENYIKKLQIWLESFLF